MRVQMILRSIGDEVRNEKRGDENMNCREWVCLFAHTKETEGRRAQRRRKEKWKEGVWGVHSRTHTHTHALEKRREREREREDKEKRSQRKTKAKGKIDRERERERVGRERGEGRNMSVLSQIADVEAGDGEDAKEQGHQRPSGKAQGQTCKAEEGAC